MASSHTTIPTPNPRERALLVQVEESVFANDPDILPATGTAYEDCAKALFAKDYQKQFSGYVYTGQSEGHGLLFAKGKTPEEATTPFRTTTWFGNHRWPPILLFVGFDVDYVAQRSYAASNGTSIGSGFGPTYYDKVVYIPDVSEGTRFVKDEFFGPAPYDIPKTPVPVPTAVQYTMPGGAGQSFPECLHPPIRIPDFQTSTTQTIGGSSANVGGSVEGQFFPGTNFETWGPYILSDKDENQNGGWYRIRIRVFPPATPDPIVRLSR